MKQDMLATSRNKGNFCVEFEDEINELELDQESEAFTIKNNQEEF
jgi:hypothetical protein